MFQVGLYDVKTYFTKLSFDYRKVFNRRSVLEGPTPVE